MMMYPNFKGKIYKLNQEYPIYDKEWDDKIIGHTAVGDMVVVTYEGIIDDYEYYETVIISGEYTGIDTLALEKSDLLDATLILNKLDECGSGVYIGEYKMNVEWK